MQGYVSLIVSALVLLSMSSAHSDELDLPSDFGVVSVEASRRAIRANIQDWVDDSKSIASDRFWACAMESGSFSYGAVPSLQLLRQAPNLVNGREAEPLRGSLRTLAERVKLTAGEEKALSRLMDREILDRSDRLRLFIDLHAFLIGVSRRLFDARIEELEAHHSSCAALTVRDERNRELVRASEKSLAYYHFLERELLD